jgi:hypothetical protein
MKTYCILIITLALAFALGCAKEQTLQYSGFLEDYTGFTQGRKGGVELVYEKEGADISKYNKLMVDEVVFYFKEDAEYKGIHADEMKKLSDALHTAIADALSRAYQLVYEPGPDVLRLRIALTDIVPSNIGKYNRSKFIPGGLAYSELKKKTTGSYAFVGRASMEAELLDSMTNERIAAAIDRWSGDIYKYDAMNDKYDNVYREKRVGAVDRSQRWDTEDRAKGWSAVDRADRWADVQDAFKFWAKRLGLWLDETHGEKKSDD